jgi:hypothetical protein
LSIAYNTPSPGVARITHAGGAVSVQYHDNFFRLTSEDDERGYTKSVDFRRITEKYKRQHLLPLIYFADFY